jgi:ribosomal protein L37AE/L43A
MTNTTKNNKKVESIAPEKYYCPVCNKNILAPYSLGICPDCGNKLMYVEYRIIQDENSGIYEVYISERR